jgi:tetratricopeptide (TPR) repeat protein
MLGLRIGTYTFTVEAPGFVPVTGSAAVRTAASPPMVFTLARDPGPIPGALPANIQAQLSAANMLRDQGRVDQAIASYQEIHAKNPKLTSVQLVIASMYRQRASQESDAVIRRGLLERAIDAYSDYLKTDAGNERAQHELELTRAEVASTR